MKVRKIIGSALALGAGLAMTAGGVALADPGDPDYDTLGNINPDQGGTIILHKFSGEPWDIDDYPADGSALTPPTGAKPLKDVGFTLYKVNDDVDEGPALNVQNPGDWEKIEELNTWFLTQTGNITGTTVGGAPGYSFEEVGDEIKTDDDGLITWGANPTLPQGVYFIQETSAPPTVAEHTLPFLVTVPMPQATVNEQGDVTGYSWLYEVNVYPKNALVDLEKEAVDPGKVGLGSDVEWVVTNKVPTIQGEFTDYRFRDVLDERLEYVADSSAIKVGDVTLSKGAVDDEADTDGDYTVTVTGQKVLVTLTEDGLAKLDANEGALQGKDLVWTFKTTVVKLLDGDGKTDGVIDNNAAVLVNTPNGDWDEVPPIEEPPSTNWGTIDIFKHEDITAKIPLMGAVFQVFASSEDADACTVLVDEADGSLPGGCDGEEYGDNDPKDKISTVKVLNNADGTPRAEDEQDKFTTGTDGKVLIPGLFVGIDDVDEAKYWVVEIVPPAGFINAGKVYDVTVTASGDAVVELDVPNTQQSASELPRTGAVVSAALKVGAALLALGAVALLVANRRKAAKSA